MGHAVHPTGFRVGKTVSWYFPSHRYGFEDYRTNLKLLAVGRYLRRRLSRVFKRRHYGLVPDLPRLRFQRGKLVVSMTIFNSAYDTFLRRAYQQRRRRLGLVVSSPNARRRRFRAPQGGWKLWARRYQSRLTLWRYLLYLRWMRRWGYHGNARLPVKSVARLRRRFGRRLKKFRRLLRRPLPVHTNHFRLYPRARRYRRGSAVKFSPKPRLFRRYALRRMIRFFCDPLGWGRFRRQTPYRLNVRLRLLLLRLLHQIRRRLPVHTLVFKPIFSRFTTMPAMLLARHIARRFRLGYNLNKLVYPMLAEARRSAHLRGLFIKFKGRLTRKPRASLNMRTFRYGKIGFSTLDSLVDYASHVFYTRYGTCTVQVWRSQRARGSQFARYNLARWRRLRLLGRGMPGLRRGLRFRTALRRPAPRLKLWTALSRVRSKPGRRLAIRSLLRWRRLGRKRNAMRLRLPDGFARSLPPETYKRDFFLNHGRPVDRR